MKTEVVELTVNEIPEVVDFVLRQVALQRGTQPPAAAATARYEWFLAQNPWRQGSFIGWGLRDAEGNLAGTNLCTWQRFVNAGGTVSALHSGDYYVAEAARGPGSLALLLNMTRHPGADLCICATANVNGAKVWKAIRGQPIQGGDSELLVPVNWPPLAAGSLARRMKWKWLSASVACAGRWLPRIGPRFPASPSVRIEALHAGDCPALPVMPSGDTWEPVRTEEWLRWRYFAAHSQSRCSLLRLSRTGRTDEMFIGTHTGNRGEGARVRALTVMDAWGAVEAFSASEVVAALVQHFRCRMDVICLRLLAASLWPSGACGSRFRKLDSVTHWMSTRRPELAAGAWRFSMACGDACL
jgi:hypothetical protein